MENYRQGDLADVVRASGGTSGGTSGSDNWKFPGNWVSYPAAAATTSSIEQACSDFFGDPSSSSMRDPLLHELDIFARTQQEARQPDYDYDLHNEFEYDDVDDDAVVMQKNSTDDDASRSMISGGGYDDRDLPTMTQLPPCNIVRNNVSVFSQMLQISTPPPPPPPPPPAEVVANELMICSSRSCQQVADSAGGVQISSPQNPVSKRRKSQAKKVVCIPAPVPANSRPSSGEVVPSDLWAWRKYGQKPIKGSPYPRGYYRCSSSKGCSARKQVERSRTDPNMLVITYTSEHNHPWPTQRNALAGSTRPHQPAAAGASSKNNNSAAAAAASKRQLLGSSSSASGSKKNYNKQVDTSTNSDGTFGGISPVTVAPASTVKLEEMATAAAAAAADVNHNADFGSEWISGEGYRPTLPDSDRSASDDFFSDLGEIEGDPLSSLLLTPGFGEHHSDKDGKPALDHFTTLFDWTTGNT